MLDLVFTSDPEMIEYSNFNHLAPLGGSDHEVLLWNVICYLEVTEANSVGKEWNYLYTSIPEMNEYLADINWAIDNKVNDNWLTLKRIMCDQICQKVLYMHNFKTHFLLSFVSYINGQTACVFNTAEG